MWKFKSEHDLKVPTDVLSLGRIGVSERLLGCFSPLLLEGVVHAGNVLRFKDGREGNESSSESIHLLMLCGDGLRGPCR